MTQQSVRIVSSGGLLYVSPPLLSVQDALYFWWRRAAKKTRTWRDSKTGEMITRDVQTDEMLSTREPLFSVTEDQQWLVTHDGLLRWVLRVLRQSDLAYTYEKVDPWPEFEWGDWVVKDCRPEQVKAVVALLAGSGCRQLGSTASPKPGPGGGMVEMTMATGKTHIIAALCRAFRRQKIVVVTYKSAVVRRLYAGLTELLGPDYKVGMVQGQIRDFQQVTVCTSALLNEFDPEDHRVVIFDEAHRAAADTVSRDLFALNRAVRFGLSGTIKKRQDGKDKYLEAILGPVVFEYNDQEAEADQRVTPQRVYALSVPRGPKVADKSKLIQERRGINENKIRNQLIRAVVDRVPPDQQLIIFVRTIKHIEHLMEMYLPGNFVVYHGELSDKVRKELEEGITAGIHKRVIANDALGEGVDTVNLDVIIDAAWTSSDVYVSQKGGRNRRLRDGKPYGVLVNFRDEWGELARLAGIAEKEAIGLAPTATEEKVDPLFDRAQKRLQQYRDRGWPIIEIEDPDEIEFVRPEEKAFELQAE